MRRTRAQQQAATRAALVRAAAEVMAERGVAGTTVEEVTSRAGFTRGAFYSNFADKDALVDAVLDARTAHEVADLTPLVVEASSPADLMGALRRRGGDPDARTWRLLLAELRLHALRVPEFRPRLAAWHQQQRDGYRAVVEHVLALGEIAPPADLDLVALILQVLDDGIADHHDIEGDGIAPQAFLDAVDLLLRAAAALTPGPPGDG
ncbi:MAG TPA: TetR/AcrR family transcriptional regulator [Iamia sp.]|nr:TetR/AcrR family transcriptional regulator [Iamia sp.]